MLQLILHTWSGKKRGFARTKVIYGIGLFVIIAVLLSMFPNMVSNKVELDSGIESEDFSPEVNNAMNQASSADVDATEDSSDAGASEESASNYIVYGERISLAKDEMRIPRFRPIFRSDYHPMGLQIRLIGKNNVLTKLGLQQNDIIKSINGTMIQNAGDLENSIFWGVSKPRMDIEIERNNESLTVTYIVKQE